MINTKYKKVFFSIFFAVSLTVILGACVGNTQKTISDKTPNLLKNQRNKMSLQKTDEISDSIDNQRNTVCLIITDISPEKAILEISNETDKSVYLSYIPTKNKEATSTVFQYWFRCKGDGEKEIDYNRLNSHIALGFEPLEKGASFRFEVNPLPKINAICKISILYYDDKKIIDLIDKFPSGLDDSEYEVIEKAKKSAEVQFQLSNK